MKGNRQRKNIESLSHGIFCNRQRQNLAHFSAMDWGKLPPLFHLLFRLGPQPSVRVELGNEGCRKPDVGSYKFCLWSPGYCLSLYCQHVASNIEFRRLDPGPWTPLNPTQGPRVTEPMTVNLIDSSQGQGPVVTSKHLFVFHTHTFKSP